MPTNRDGIIQPTPARSRNMAAVRRSNTKPELLLRQTLHAQGHRFRKDFPVRLGGRVVRPDIAYTKFKVAVFVDGCFWHSCPEHRQTPATNTSFWEDKLAGNVERDRMQDQLLDQAGWTVVRIWEHVPVVQAAALVTEAVEKAKRAR